MKKITSFLLALVILISCITLLVSCNSSSKKVDNEKITQIITHINANELNEALTKCQSLNQKTLEAGKDEILNCVLKKLEHYLYSGNWTFKTYYLIDPKAIKELKLYQA